MTQQHLSALLDLLQMKKTKIEINLHVDLCQRYSRQETIELVIKEWPVDAQLSILIRFHRSIVHQLYLGYPVVRYLLSLFHQYQYPLWQELDLESILSVEHYL